MNIGTRVTPTNPFHHIKHGFGCVIDVRGNEAIVHFENGTRGVFNTNSLKRQLAKSEVIKTAIKDMVKG